MQRLVGRIGRDVITRRDVTRNDGVQRGSPEAGPMDAREFEGIGI